MSKKRTSAESSYDDQTTEDSDAVFRQVDDAKRGKLASFNDTTIQDLPIEMLECILVKAIAMEVKNMKLAKSVWKEKADLVISRLRTVCSNWSNILSTNFFRNELHRAIDGIAQEKIRLEILQESLVDCCVFTITTIKDDILMFCRGYDQDNVTSARSTCRSFNITVYDRNNMEEVKDVIALPEMRYGTMAACNVSDCVYVGLNENRELHCSSVLRITRDEEHKYNTQTWISDLRDSISFISLSVSDKGNLIIISRLEEGSRAVSVYTPNGFLQHEVMLSPDVCGFRYIESHVIQKSNGNLVLAIVSGPQFQTVLTEIDIDGIIQRQYKSSLTNRNLTNLADNSGRILIHDQENEIELLDSELNPLDFAGPKPNQSDFYLCHSLHYNSERNELMGICAVDADLCLLRIFRFREE